MPLGCLLVYRITDGDPSSLAPRETVVRLAADRFKLRSASSGKPFLFRFVLGIKRLGKNPGASVLLNVGPVQRLADELDLIGPKAENRPVAVG